MRTDQLAAIASRYGLSDIVETRIGKQGFLNRNIILKTATADYFLKEQNETNAKRIHLIEQAESVFESHYIPVITPIETTEHQKHILLDGKAYTLYPFIHGHAVSNHALQPSHAAALGQMLAHLHLVSKGQSFQGMDNKPPEIFDVNVFDKKISILQKIIEDKTEADDTDKAIQRIIAMKQQIIHERWGKHDITDDASETLIHGDYYHDNVFFDNNAQVQWVFDLEKVCVAPRAYEFVRSLLLICFNENFEERNFHLADAFIRHYDALYPMPKDSIKRMLNQYVLKAAFSTWLSEEIYTKQNLVMLPLVKNHEVLLSEMLYRWDRVEGFILDCLDT